MESLATMFDLYFYLECDDGYFGPNCIEPCNATCRSCNKSSGVCDNGCKPGWRGLYCQEGIFCYSRLIHVQNKKVILVVLVANKKGVILTWPASTILKIK